MDEEGVYANMEPSGAQINWKRAQSNSGNTSVNEDRCHAVEPHNTLSDLEKSNTVKKHTCIATTLILGLLCLLLLAGLMILVFLNTKGNSNWEMKILQLQTSYINLTDENHQLKISYDNLREEKARLKKNLEDATTDLRRKLKVLHWTYFADKYYYISSTTQTWQDSRNDCLQKGADLVIINSPEEQEFIRSWKKLTWIGLTDTEKEGTWKWVDGTLLGNLRYWAESEPNNENGNENCAEMRYYALEMSWNDAPCDIKRYWICEVQLNN